MNRYVVTQTAALINTYMRENEAPYATFCPIAHISVRIYLRAVANAYAIANVGKSTDVDIFADLCRWSNESKRVNTAFLGLHRLIQL